jgi:hypothetical protein
LAVNRNLRRRPERLERSAPAASEGPSSPASVLLLVLAPADPELLTAEQRAPALAVQAAWDEMRERVLANPTPAQQRQDELKRMKAEDRGREAHP